MAGGFGKVTNGNSLAGLVDGDDAIDSRMVQAIPTHRDATLFRKGFLGEQGVDYDADPVDLESDPVGLVEVYLCNLIRSGQGYLVRAVLGGSRDAPEDAPDMLMIRRALAAEPNLKWYATLGADKAFEFDLEDGLEINASLRAVREKVLPYAKDFHGTASEITPALAALCQAAQESAGRKVFNPLREIIDQHTLDIHHEAVATGSVIDQDDLVSGEDDDAVDIMGAHTADMALSPGLFSTSDDVAPVQDYTRTADTRFDISMNDLSNKAVAEHLCQANIETGNVAEYLKDEGFTTARANEIQGIVKYMRLNRELRARGFTAKTDRSRSRNPLAGFEF